MKKYKDTFLIIFIILLSICFALPSIIYYTNNKTVLNFNNELEFCFLLTNNIDRFYQAGTFALILLAFIICYYYIIKNKERLFKNIKKMYLLIFAVSAIFILVLPFFSSDIFYYLGIGRLNSAYEQNPYYTSIKDYVESNDLNIENDMVMQKGYKNVWAHTTVVYGAIWTTICSLISFFSFGNLDLGLLLFKIINLIAHMGNCYLLYKISKKKIFPLIYGLNPFILIEGIANVHNDMFVVFFILMSLYMIVKRKNIILSILFLAIATDIKYFTILFLPLIIIYHYKDASVKIRIIKCLEYGAIFAIFVIIPYLFYIRDLNIFTIIFEQQNKYSKGLYKFVLEYFNYPYQLVDKIKLIMISFVGTLYIYTCLSLLIKKKEIRFYREMRKLFWIICAFIFLIITNSQPWYLMWLIPFIIWQRPENIKLIIQTQIISLMTNIVFLIYSEDAKYGIPYFVILVFGILLSIIYNKNERYNRLIKQYQFKRRKT